MNQKGSALIFSLINLVFGVIVALVGLRFLFVLLGANPDAGLVNWVYTMSTPLVAPFYGLFPNVEATISSNRLDIPSLTALIVYGIVATLLSRLAIGRPAHGS